jgi:predicted GNAT family acetyltransferase
MDLKVTDNPGQARFEIRADGEPAGFLAYHRRGHQISLIHTETDDRFRGQGAGGRLVQAALDAARDQQLTVLPYCPFAREWIERHPGYIDLVPEDRRPDFGL